MTNFKNYSLYLNGFLKNLASNLEQNRSNLSPARVFAIFVQPSLPDFPGNSIPFMNIRVKHVVYQ